MENINTFLMGLRKRRGLTLREAAEKSGLSHSYISSLESGKHPKTKAPINPSPESLKGLSEAYNYPYEELMKIAGYIEETPRRIINDQTKNDVSERISRLPLEDQKLIDDMLDALEKRRHK